MWIERLLLIAIGLALTLYGQTVNTAELKFREAVHKEQVQGDLAGAIKLYQAAAAGDNRTLAAKALVSLGRCYEKQGSAEARKAYEKVLSSFADQGEPVREARVRLAKIAGASSGKGELIARRAAKPLDSWPIRTVSRDGRYAAYVFQRRSTPMLLDLTTGVERPLGDGKLVPVGIRSHSAAISPDGSEVAFDYGRPDGGSEIRLVKVGAMGTKTVYRGKGGVFLADWSRDGKRLLIGEHLIPEGIRQSHVVDIGTGAATLVQTERLTIQRLSRRNATRHALMRISPDGRFVAYTVLAEQSNAPSSAVFVRAIEEAGAPQLVAGHRADAYVFDWSPDGRHLLFISDESGAHDLWALPMAQGKPAGVPRRLKKDIGQVQASGTTEAGTIFYSVMSETGETYLGDIDIAAAIISGLRVLPRPRGESNGATSWSADGKQVLVNRFFGRGPVIYDVETGRERPLEIPELTPAAQTANVPMLRYAMWSPGAKSMLFGERTQAAPSRSTILLADAIGHAVRNRLSVSGHVGFKQLSPDERYVFGVRGVNEMNNTRVVRIDLESSEEKEICPARFIVWGLSPDATQVACGGFGDGIRVYSASGGPGRDLVKGGSFGSIEWTPDGKHILYSVGSTGPTPGYWMIPAQGGQPRKMQIDLQDTGLMSISPDGKRIAITTTGRSVELWALENVLSQLK